MNPIVPYILPGMACFSVMFHQNSKLSCLGLCKAELAGLVLGIMTLGCLHRAPPK